MKESQQSYQRYPRYFRVLRTLLVNGIMKVSSVELARHLNITPSTVRADLNRSLDKLILRNQYAQVGYVKSRIQKRTVENRVAHRVNICADNADNQFLFFHLSCTSC